MAKDMPSTLEILEKVPSFNINCKAFGKSFGNSARKVWTSFLIPSYCVCLNEERRRFEEEVNE